MRRYQSGFSRAHEKQRRYIGADRRGIWLYHGLAVHVDQQGRYIEHRPVHHLIYHRYPFTALSHHGEAAEDFKADERDAAGAERDPEEVQRKR